MNDRSRRTALLLLFCVIAAPFLGALQRNVVIFHSYHQGFLWTDRIQAGLQESLQRFGPAIDIRVEYLDAKRHPLGGSYQSATAELFRVKFAKVHPDVIVVSDNAALSFVIANRDSLFNAIPIVFCGINNYVPALLGGATGITGVSEDPEISGTIRSAFEITGAGSLAIITDSTDTGVRNRKVALEALQVMAGSAPSIILDGSQYDLKELCGVLQNLGPDWVVLFLDFFQDKWDEYLAIEAVLPAICEASPVPVFTHTDLYFGLGPVGGILNRGMDQGRIAGELAGKILDGVPVGSIPVIAPSSPVPVFDFRSLKHHRLSEEKLPAGSLVFYRPTSLWNAYRPYIIGGIAVFLLLSTAVAGLSFAIAGKRRAEIALIKSREQLRSIYNGMSDAVFIHDPTDGSILDANETAIESYSYSLDQLRTMRVSDLSEDTSDASQELALSMIRRAALGEPLRFKWRARRFDGSCFTSEIAMRRAIAGDREVVIVSGRDVSEREQARLELEQMLHEKQNLLKEIHHRVKNNFQIISSLLDLQLMDVQARCTNNSLEVEALRDPRDRIHAMALVHELLYRAGDFASIDLDDYLKELTSYIASSYDSESRGIEYTLETGSVMLDIDRAIPCGLVVNELLVNAFKYAFDKDTPGRILFSVRRTGPRLYLSLADNGIGLPPQIISGERTGGLGLTLVHNLVQQLKGNLEFGTGIEGRGATVRFDFPLE